MKEKNKRAMYVSSKMTVCAPRLFSMIRLNKMPIVTSARKRTLILKLPKALNMVSKSSDADLFNFLHGFQNFDKGFFDY